MLAILLSYYKSNIIDYSLHKQNFYKQFSTVKKKAIHRLFEYLALKGQKHTRAEKDWGLSNGYLNTQLKRGADLGEGVIVKIVNYCLDLNIEWLLTGKGECIKIRNSYSELSEPVADYKLKNDLLPRLNDKDEIIKLQREKISTLEKELANYLSKKNRPPHSSAKHKSELNE